MAALNIIPQTNVRAEDIRDTLASHGGTVGNDIASFFKEAAKLNVWSQFLPFEYDAPFVDDESIRKKYRWKWSQAFNGNTGSYIVHNAPTGYKRLGDFRSYNPNTQPPGYSVRIERVSGQSATNINVGFIPNENYDFSNVTGLSNGYAISCKVGDTVIPMQSIDGEWYGTKSITSSASAFSYVFGCTPLKADGTTGGGIIEFGVLQDGAQFGRGTSNVITLTPTNTPTRGAFENPWSIVLDDVSIAAKTSTSDVNKTQVSISIEASHYASVPSAERTKPLYCRIVKISDGTQMMAKTLVVSSFTLRAKTTLSFSVNYKYVSTNLEYRFTTE